MNTAKQVVESLVHEVVDEYVIVDKTGFKGAYVKSEGDGVGPADVILTRDVNQALTFPTVGAARRWLDGNDVQDADDYDVVPKSAQVREAAVSPINAVIDSLRQHLSQQRGVRLMDVEIMEPEQVALIEIQAGGDRGKVRSVHLDANGTLTASTYDEHADSWSAPVTVNDAAGLLNYVRALGQSA